MQRIHAVSAAVALCALVGLAPTPTPVPQAGGAELGNYHEKWNLPDEPSARRIGHLLEALSRGDEAFTRAFIESAFTADFLDMAPMEGHLAQFASLSQTFGAFELIQATRVGRTSELTLRTGDGTVLLLKVGTRDDAPYPIDGITIDAVDDASSRDDAHRGRDRAARSASTNAHIEGGTP